jgi:hypothetical protein
MRGLVQALGGLRRNPNALLATSVFFAGLFCGELNLWSARNYARFDTTADARFTLESQTRSLLRSLSEPLEIVVFLAPNASLYPQLRLLLETFAAEGSALRVRYIDPERQPAEYLRELGGDLPGKGSENMALLVEQHGRKVSIPREELEANPAAQSKHIEASLARAIEEVGRSQADRICLVTGHGEPQGERRGEGLGHSEQHIARLGFELEETALDVPAPDQALKACSWIAVIAPTQVWPKSHVSAVLMRLRAGAHLFLALSPTVDARGELKDLGLAPLLEALGVRFINEFVLEQDPTLRFSDGMGEIFFAEPKTHPITRGLAQGQLRLDARPVVALSGAFEVTDPSRAVSVLESSPSSFSLRALAEPEGERHGPFSLAVAFEGAPTPAIGSPSQGAPTVNAPPSRAVLFSFASLIAPGSGGDYSTRGNELLLENSLLWLKGRTQLASLASGFSDAEPSEGLHLTEESLSALGRYVLWEIPGASLLFALAVYWLRGRGALFKSPLHKRRAEP